MRSSANNICFRQGSRRGTSLIEILVVLVILVVGIFSIARLFPGGFFAVRSAENNTFADRLAQGQLESLKQNNAFLLDAVYMYNPDGTFSPNILPDDLSGTAASPFLASGASAGDTSYNDIDKARFISGETFLVPSANTATGTTTNGVPIHVLNYGPVALPLLPTVISTSPTAPAAVRGLPPIHSAPWAAKVGNSQSSVPADTTGTYQTAGGFDPPADLITVGQPNYAVDYTGQRISVPPATYRQYFTLVIRRVVTASNTSTVVTFYYPLLLPPADPTQTGTNKAYNGDWFDPTDPNSGTTYTDPARPIVTDVTLPSGSTVSNWIPGTATLVRTLQPQTAGSDLASTLASLRANPDPYTYVLLSDFTNNSIAVTNVSLGVFAFSPRLTGQNVSVSYLAYDWHVVHEDLDAPESASTPLRLTLNHLKRVGDVQSDQTVYDGLFRPGDTNPSTGTNYDIVLLDTDTGDSYGLSVADTTHVFDQDNATGSAVAAQIAVSYMGGRVTLPADTASPWYYVNHKHLRVFYEGDLGWAVALQKAPSLYAFGDPTTQAATYNFSSIPGHLLFPASDEGKAVEADNITYYDQNGVMHQVAVASGTVTTDFRDTHYIDLTPFIDTSQFDSTKPIQVGDVRGVSARSVVIWKERTQWKSRAVDTILTRAH